MRRGQELLRRFDRSGLMVPPESDVHFAVRFPVVRKRYKGFRFALFVRLDPIQ